MSIEKLITDLATGNDRQRRAASYKLLKLHDPSTVPDLIAAFEDKDHSVRRNVIAALRAIGNKEAIEFLESKRIKASDASEKTASAAASMRTKGCLLSWFATLVTFIVGGYLIAVFVSLPSGDPSPEMSWTDQKHWLVVVAAGFASYYFVRKFYNDRAAKLERTQLIKEIALESRTQKIMESVQMPAGTVCPECGHVNKQPQNSCQQCGKNYVDVSWDKPGAGPET